MWNVIFKEEITHIASQPIPLVFNNNNTKSIVPLSQRIVLRLTILPELHKEIVERPVSRVDVKQKNNNVIDEKEKKENLPLIIRKTC